MRPSLLLPVVITVCLLVCMDGYSQSPFRATLGPPDSSASTAEALVQKVIENNPQLQKLRMESQAAWQRVPQVGALPDPVIGSNIFITPIETAAGSYRANLTVGQRFPWLKRLTALEQQAVLSATALDLITKAETLKVAADTKSGFYQLYLLGQKIRINKTNIQLLQSLSQVAAARIRAGKGSQGDVLRSTLELSRIKTELMDLEKAVVATRAKLNALLNRSPETEIFIPETLSTVEVSSWHLQKLQDQSAQFQPEIIAAGVRQEAAGLGIRIAQLQRVPDLTVNFNWIAIEDNRPFTRIVDVGQDAISLGAAVNIPLWHAKYRAMRREAEFQWEAAAAQRIQLMRKYQAAIAEALAEAKTAEEIEKAYRNEILPQAKETLQIDSQSYQQGTVEFDRVITDFRNLVTLETGLHTAIARRAIAIARLEQLVGQQLTQQQIELPPPGVLQDDGERKRIQQ